MDKSHVRWDGTALVNEGDVDAPTAVGALDPQSADHHQQFVAACPVLEALHKNTHYRSLVLEDLLSDKALVGTDKQTKRQWVLGNAARDLLDAMVHDGHHTLVTREGVEALQAVWKRVSMADASASVDKATLRANAAHARAVLATMDIERTPAGIWTEEGREKGQQTKRTRMETGALLDLCCLPPPHTTHPGTSVNPNLGSEAASQRAKKPRPSKSANPTGSAAHSTLGCTGCMLALVGMALFEEGTVLPKQVLADMIPVRCLRLCKALLGVSPRSPTACGAS